jgi:hypothetical protein
MRLRESLSSVLHCNVSNHLPEVFTLVFVSTKSIVGYLAGGSFVVSEMLLHC